MSGLRETARLAAVFMRVLPRALPMVVRHEISGVRDAFSAAIDVTSACNLRCTHCYLYRDEVLARTLDHQRVEGPFDADQMWGITSRIAQSWSRLLGTRLRELSGLYPSRLRRLQELSGD